MSIRLRGLNREVYTLFLRQRTEFGDGWNPISWGGQTDKYSAVSDDGLRYVAEVSDDGIEITLDDT